MGVQKNFITSFWQFFKAITLKTIFDGSAHTFGSSQRFLKVPQKGVYLNYLLEFLPTVPGGGGGYCTVYRGSCAEYALLFFSDPQKLNLNILNMAWWSIGTNNVFVDKHNFF